MVVVVMASEVISVKRFWTEEAERWAQRRWAEEAVIAAKICVRANTRPELTPEGSMRRSPAAAAATATATVTETWLRTLVETEVRRRGTAVPIEERVATAMARLARPVPGDSRLVTRRSPEATAAAAMVPEPWLHTLVEAKASAQRAAVPIEERVAAALARRGRPVPGDSWLVVMGRQWAVDKGHRNMGVMSDMIRSCITYE